MPSSIPTPSLSGAVDLSTLASRPQPPAMPTPAAPAVAPAPGAEIPQEFTLSLGGVDGQTVVLMGFGHLRWQFTPELAEDLAQGLLDAANRARHVTVDADGLIRPVTP